MHRWREICVIALQHLAAVRHGFDFAEPHAAWRGLCEFKDSMYYRLPGRSATAAQPEEQKQVQFASAQPREARSPAVPAVVQGTQPEQVRVKQAQPERQEHQQPHVQSTASQGQKHASGDDVPQQRPRQKRAKTAAKASALKAADEGSKREAPEAPDKTARPAKILAAKTMPRPSDAKQGTDNEDSAEAMAAGYAALAAAYFAAQEEEEAEARKRMSCKHGSS